MCVCLDVMLSVCVSFQRRSGDSVYHKSVQPDSAESSAAFRDCGQTGAGLSQLCPGETHTHTLNYFKHKHFSSLLHQHSGVTEQDQAVLLCCRSERTSCRLCLHVRCVSFDARLPPVKAKVTTELNQVLDEEEKRWMESLHIEEYQITLAKTVIQVHPPTPRYRGYCGPNTTQQL